METDVSSFFQPPAQRFPELSGIVREEMGRLLRPSSLTLLPHPDCLFSSIQSYLALLLTLLPKLAEQLMSGPHVTNYINTLIAEADEDTDFSDLERFNLLSERQRDLRHFVGVLQRYSAEISNQLKPSAPPTPSTLSSRPPLTPHSANPLPPPLPGPRPRISSPLYGAPPLASFPNSPNPDFVDHELSQFPRAPHRWSGSVESMHNNDAYNESPGSSSSLAEAGDMPRELARRGKGHYNCPHMLECTKGGVSPDGTLIIFERNSAFRAHLQKHDKPFRCDLPGCTNQRGFARADQLRRHQETTRHG